MRAERAPFKGSLNGVASRGDADKCVGFLPTERRMRSSILVLLLMVGLLACERKTPERRIADLGANLKYVALEEFPGEPRVIGLSGLSGMFLVIPGDVTWCERRGRFIVGHKNGMAKPIAWMSSSWETSGYFALHIDALPPGASSDQEFEAAVKWYSNSNALPRVR
jgi:hypothetical protein